MAHRSANARNLLSLATVVIGTLGVLAFAQTVLESMALASTFVSTSSWRRIVDHLGGSAGPAGPGSVSIPIVTSLSLGIVGLSAVTWFCGAWFVRKPGRETYGASLISWGLRGWVWWLAPGAWWLCWNVSIQFADERWIRLLAGSAPLWISVAMSGWVATAWTLRTASRPLRSSGTTSPDQIAVNPPARPAIAGLLLAVAVYTVVFTGMNWGLWFNLRLPHGDSAMYEEHLWNLTHGKGFRSYLDQGLFLGEHLQVIHVLLVPLHWIWPSQLLLELCESVALALGAVPVFLITRRHSGQPRTALLLALAYLLCFPVQYLDIAIDLKTFRPIAFGVPLLLSAIDCMERRRYRAMTLLLLLTISAKEDYAIVIALLGVWLCLSSARAGRSTRQPQDAGPPPAGPRRQPIIAGALMAVLAGVYLFVAVKFAIPWFRGGETVHYARYFEQFGDTPGEILTNMVMRPDLLLGELVTVNSGLYVLRLLAPLALLPLLSPGRLLVGAPLIALLCLNEISQGFPAPVHHFHAPLVPVLFWSAAGGLGRLARSDAAAARQEAGSSRSLFAARMACLCALTTGISWSLGPVGSQFWDPGSPNCWRMLYVTSDRARGFDRIAELIPASARVASTDFVHPRFTHCERSYDYSDYPRAVADYEDRVPHDTDYIVIDVEHPYNDPRKIAALRADPYSEVRELIREPDRWELLPETGNGYFLVLKRHE